MTPPGVTPPGETPPGQTPPGETPPGETPPGETPPGETPPAECPPPGDDTEIPTAPGQPVCQDIGSDQLGLDWPVSTDNVEVVGYDIFDGSTTIANAPAPPVLIVGLTPATTYQFTVVARDAAGNVSDSSPMVECATTEAGDTEAPSAPAELTQANVTATTVDLSWQASTGEPTAYLVRDAEENVLATTAGDATSATVSGLTCATPYTVHVVARDAAGNLSEPSGTQEFTTAACAESGVPQEAATLSEGWTIPWDVAWSPTGDWSLVTQRDDFKVFKVTAAGERTEVGTVPETVTTDGEGGLMGIAVPATWNGTTDRDVYVMHTAAEGNRVARMAFDGTALSDYRTVLTGIRKNRFHNGGRIRFGPDGFLYVTTGDAQQPSLAQDPTSLNGKILRITKDGAAAPGNPSGTPVYSLGHRNPQGLAWDSAGRLWSSELGNMSWDELNLIEAGKNYGWPTCEGECATEGMTNPKKTWTPAMASPSGLAIVGDTAYVAAMRGERLWRVPLNGTEAGEASAYFQGEHGRLRAVEKVPDADALWLGTTNGEGDKLLRVPLG
ncbi:PQQ-dependent sugar dehydrogenase [Acrocarpospora phusangensis]|uniref:PQQ-dependent sugar dehydrogenase n=1 Tax=Acrocarpospora phusangensis TaxID=1070424 RepID=UPI001EF21DDC|nr:PQQ-dependent sugar dehydrogenase [Acrocarpospora phusangensis]